jgi:hypothetical protein
VKNEEGANKDLNCWVVGYQNSPLEKFEYSQQSQPQYPAPSYGQGYSTYAPQYPSYYPVYEYSRTPRRAKVHKVEEYTASYYPKPPSYAPTYKTENWEADYSYDACHADVGAAIFCQVQSKYVDEESRPAYPESYPPSYPAPSYTPPSYYPPAYPQSYPTPSYPTPSYPTPSYPTPSYPTPSYPTPSYYESPKYKRAAYYTPPSYTPQYPSYPTPSYPTPSYPTYEPEYKAPIKNAEPICEESRRVALYGIVQYPPECSSYGSSSADKKLTATPVEDILPWIKTVTRLQPSCSYQPSYSY